MNPFSDALCEVFSCAAETYSAKGLRNLLTDKAALHQCKRGMLALGPCDDFLYTKDDANRNLMRRCCVTNRMDCRHLSGLVSRESIRPGKLLDELRPLSLTSSSKIKFQFWTLILIGLWAISYGFPIAYVLSSRFLQTHIDPFALHVIWIRRNPIKRLIKAWIE